MYVERLVPVTAFSVRIRSSCTVAIARRGPIRICTLPLQRTGGESDGCTVTTATSLSSTAHFPTVIEGGGTMLPSVFMSANCLSNSSVTVTPATVRSFRTPTKTTPGLPYPGRSLAKAQIASRIFVAASPESDSLHSTRSDSSSFSSRIKSSFPRVVTVAPIHFPATALAAPSARCWRRSAQTRHPPFSHTNRAPLGQRAKLPANLNGRGGLLHEWWSPCGYACSERGLGYYHRLPARMSSGWQRIGARGPLRRGRACRLKRAAGWTADSGAASGTRLHEEARS